MAWTVWHLSALFATAVCFLFPYLRSQRRQDPSLHGSVETAKTADAVQTAGTVKTRTASASKVKQPYDAFLVLDVEGTCQQGSNFDYPNEIIEFPVCLMRWKDRDGGNASQLEVIAEFRSFVKPSWRPTLSEFCTELTGITQDQVDSAPDFPSMLRSFRAFLVQHKLIGTHGKRILRYCWCTDGPWDIRDFVVKQCFISRIPFPDWMTGDVLNVRTVVISHTSGSHTSGTQPQDDRLPKIVTLNIPGQLLALGLSPFLGRQHSGIDDTRNLARIITQLALEGVSLQPNTTISLRRRWAWMGKSGQILEQHLTC
ncbi:ribonuclease H-like domain-containing protein [Mycena albidolilacea]|uniref:Ribonuclease H-like domain-containing protein n=1 Tax=Mycena albidolilacea TaxID=1033008 RepID=A0AAD7A4X6_9AGAR|nr:ribonuclease H-like domain-containing protein [Mycena albidolilacea]